MASKELTVKIKYFEHDGKTVTPVEAISVGDWIDLRTAVDVRLHVGEAMQIPLGVGMILPAGYEAHVAPRSSMFGNYGIIQANSVGVIDNSYCGDADEWLEPVIAMRETHIPRDTRICQFRIIQNQPTLKFETVEHLKDKSRGGFGSTGV